MMMMWLVIWLATLLVMWLVILLCGCVVGYVVVYMFGYVLFVLCRGLLFLKDYSGDVATLGLDFTVANNQLGTVEVSEICEINRIYIQPNENLYYRIIGLQKFAKEHTGTMVNRKFVS